MTTFNGNGAKITKQAMELMAGQAGLAGAKAVRDLAEEIYDVVRHFSINAKHIGINPALIKEIQHDINHKWEQLK